MSRGFSAWARGLMGAGAAAAVALVLQSVINIPNPGVFYVLTVFICGFLGGLPATLGALPILWLGIALVYSTPGHRFSYTDENRLRMIVVLIGVPVAAVLVSILKSRADRSLAASEARFETLVNALPFGLLVSRGDRIILANPAAVDLFRADTAAALTGGSMWDTVHPDYREIVRQRMAMLDGAGGNGAGGDAGGRRLEAIEEKFLRLDGTVLDAEVSAARVELDGGHGRLVVVRDIAARKRMEERIREQVRDLSLLHEVSRALLFGLAPADIPEYLCGLVVERLGAKTACVGNVAEASGIAVTTEVIVGDDTCSAGDCDGDPAGSGRARRDGPDALAAANAKPIVMRDLQADRRAAAWQAWARTRGHRAAACIPLIGPDRVLAVLSVFFDDPDALDDPRSDLLQSLGNLAAIALSEAHTKEQIRRSQARLELAMEAGRMGAFEWDLRSGEIVWEAHHAALFGMAPTDFDGTYESFARRIHPDDRPTMERGVALARDTRGLFEQEYRAVWPDGSVHWIAGRGRFVYDDAGRAVRMSGIVLDIDRRRHAEAVALEQQAQLAHVQRLTLVSQLASGLAHEVNQPLTAVSNFAGAALQLHRDARLTPDAARDYFAEVHAQAQRAGEIVRRMRGFMQKRGPEVVRGDLNALVAEALALMGPELSRGRVRATFEPAADLPSVRIDPVQVQQVLVNLIQNGIDAMADAPEEQRTLSVRVGRCDGRATVRVTDAGHGIASGDLAHVFDSFFSTKPGGLGMGLNISRSIVESHGGSLTAANNPPPAAPGATFEFALPIGD